MQQFQERMFQDLRGRLDVLTERLDEAARDPELKLHAADIKRALTGIGDAVDRLLADPSRNRPELDRQHRAIYQRLNEQVFIVKSYLIPALERFNEHDRRLTLMVRKLGEQINWPMPTPLVISDSTQYYMTFPTFQLMRVPAGEDENLLAYPDLIHEMAHILLTKERGRMVGDFVTVLGDYVADQQRLGGPDAPSPHLFEQWRQRWLEEYLCDMIAVYVTGPAFGSAHVGLIAGMPAASFKYGQSHPPDESRVRVTAAVLRAMGKDADARSVEALWQEYFPSTGEVKPRGYDRVVPDHLIDALARRVVDGCRQLNLRAYDAPDVSKPDDVVGMVIEGWRRFGADAATFAGWQSARLRMLWKQLGIGGPAGPTIAARTGPLRPQAPPPPVTIRPTSSGHELAA